MTTARSLDLEALISDRARGMDASGIRRVFELGAKLKNPFNFSIGQPDFPVPEPIKDAAIRAIRENRNGYTITQGVPELLRRICAHLHEQLGWNLPSNDLGVIVTAGTSGAMYLASMALLNAGDEAIIADPYFVLYPNLGRLTGATCVTCDTYPDGRMTAERVEPLITPRTKLIIVNSPGNPTGVVLTAREMQDLVDLCERRGVLLVSDEIYDTFTYADAREEGRCPTPGRYSDRVLVVRGFGKSYGCTGWRMGYAAGPKRIVEEIAKLQQYTYVCAPSMAQFAAVAAFDVDMSPMVEAYQRKRDLVLRTLRPVTDVIHPGGAFYAFVKVPERLGLTASAFADRAIDHNVLVIPGKVFSRRDTHFRLSYAVSDDMLRGGLAALMELMHGQH